MPVERAERPPVSTVAAGNEPPRASRAAVAALVTWFSVTVVAVICGVQHPLTALSISGVLILPAFAGWIGGWKSVLVLAALVLTWQVTWMFLVAATQSTCPSLGVALDDPVPPREMCGVPWGYAVFYGIVASVGGILPWLLGRVTAVISARPAVAPSRTGQLVSAWSHVRFSDVAAALLALLVGLAEGLWWIAVPLAVLLVPPAVLIRERSVPLRTSARQFYEVYLLSAVAVIVLHGELKESGHSVVRVWFVLLSVAWLGVLWIARRARSWFRRRRAAL